MFKRGITFGVFDCLHQGHINLFNKASLLCDELIIAVQTDVNVYLNKPNVRLVDDLGVRIDKISRLSEKYIVIPYNQVDETIKCIDFDVFFVGEDQNNSHFNDAIRWCNNNFKEIIKLKRTPNISSSLIRGQKNEK